LIHHLFFSEMGVQSKFLKIALGAIFTGLPLGLPAAALSI